MAFDSKGSLYSHLKAFIAFLKNWKIIPSRTFKKRLIWKTTLEVYDLCKGTDFNQDTWIGSTTTCNIDNSKQNYRDGDLIEKIKKSIVWGFLELQPGDINLRSTQIVFLLTTK